MQNKQFTERRNTSIVIAHANLKRLETLKAETGEPLNRMVNAFLAKATAAEVKALIAEANLPGRGGDNRQGVQRKSKKNPAQMELIG